MNNRKWIYGSFILLQALIYGVGNVITKVAYESITPFWSLTIRFAIASLIFALLSGKHIMAQLKQARPRDWLPAGLCMATCYITCGVALALTSATNVGFLISLPVIFTPFVAMFVLHQRYRLINLPIQIAMIAGLYMLCSNSGSFVFGWGDILATLAAITSAGAFVFGERGLKNLDEITISAVQTWLTFVISIPWPFIFERDFSFGQVTPGAWAVVLYLAVLCTVVAFRLQNKALTKISSQTVAILLCGEPVFTAIISRFVLGEILNPIGIAGAVIILVCIFAGNSIPSKEETLSQPG